MVRLKFSPGGKVRAIHDDNFPWEKAFGPDFAASRRRASIINTVEDGPNAGRFYVDFSHLADATGDEKYRVCLTHTFDREGVAKEAEVVWLTANYIQRRDDVQPPIGEDGRAGRSEADREAAQDQEGDQ